MSSDTEDAPKVEFDTWGEATCFKGTSYANGKDFITTERLGGGPLPCLNGGFLSFELSDGLTQGEVTELLRLMSERISGMTYCGPAQPGWPLGRRGVAMERGNKATATVLPESPAEVAE
jgi:hypothetical protein